MTHVCFLAYDYEQLDRIKQQIRLIALHPATSPGDPTRCDIQIFNLKDDPHYITLFYTWAPAATIKVIFVNGRNLAFRQNLSGFLDRHRNDPSDVHYF